VQLGDYGDSCMPECRHTPCSFAFFACGFPSENDGNFLIFKTSLPKQDIAAKTISLSEKPLTASCSAPFRAFSRTP
jgi:hypothetical protein